MFHARLIATLAGALVAAACSQAKPSATHDATHEAAEAHETSLPLVDVAAELKTPLADAIAAALANTPGEAMEAELEGEMENGRRDVFVEVMVLAANGDAIEVKVDPATGKVRSAEKSDEPEEAGELAEVSKKLPSGHLSLADLVKRAAAGAEGRMVTAEFDVSKEHGAVGVVRFLVGKDLRQFTLDAKTAAVLAKKTLTAGDDDDDDEDDDEDDDDEDDGMERK